MMRQTVQLSLQGRPSAFDLSPSKLEICVASPGSLSFFDLNGVGAPRQLLHYEQPQQVRKVIFREFGQVAVLRGGAVSFFDATNILRPLKSSLKLGGWVNDIDWAAMSSTVIAVACDNGQVKLFDTRTLGSPIGNMYTTSNQGPKLSVRWSPSGGGGDSSYLAASTANAVNIWDMRKSASLAEIHASTLEGLTHFLWDTNTSQTASGEVGLMTCSKGSLIEWYSAPTFEKMHSAVSTQVDIDDKSLLLSIGRRSFVCSNENPVNTSINIVGNPKAKIGSESLFCPSQEVASCKDGIVGLCLGNPVRLLGSSSGVEALLLTVSSSLHSIRIPISTLNEFGGKVDRSSTRKGRASSGDNMSFSGFLNKSGPQFSTGLLCSSYNSGGDISPAVPMIRDVSMKSLSSASSLAADRGREFWQNLQTDVLVLESLLQEFACGVIVESVDKYARQLTFVTRQKSSIDTNSSSTVGEVDFSLIVSLPARYPLSGVPSFTIRQSSSTSETKAPNMSKFIAGVTADLSNIVRSSELAEGGSNHQLVGVSQFSMLMYQIALCFSDRVSQYGTSQFTLGSDSIETDAKDGDTDLQEALVLCANISTSEAQTLALDETRMASVADTVIDPRAYQVLCPRSSGAIFTNEGKILCYGGAEVFYDLLKDQDVKGGHPLEAPTRTYADMLLKRRDRAVLQEVDPDSSSPNKVERGSRRYRIDSLSLKSVETSLSIPQKDEKRSQRDERLPADLAIASFFDQLTLNKSNSGDDLLEKLGRGLDKIAIAEKSEPRNFAERDSIDSSLRSTKMTIETTLSSGSVSVFPTQIKVYNLWSSIPEKILAEKYLFGTGSTPRETKDLVSSLFEPRSAKVRVESCRHNSKLCQMVGRKTLCRVWALLAIALESMIDTRQHDAPWFVQAMGGSLLSRVFMNLVAGGDFQTLSVLICILGGCENAAALLEKCISANESLAHSRRSSSLDLHRAMCCYADTLRRWQKFHVATEVMKFSKSKLLNSAEYELSLTYKCHRCQYVISSDSTFGDEGLENTSRKVDSKKTSKKRLMRRNWCRNCQNFGILCCICNLPVRTSGSFCFSCGHGGHSQHMRDWFEISSFCPSGCGCRCADSSLSNSSVGGIVPSSSSSSLVLFLESKRPQLQQELYSLSNEKSLDIKVPNGYDIRGIEDIEDLDDYSNVGDVDYIGGFDPED